MVKITGVEPHSRAEMAGITAGDALLSLNGNPIADVLDYRFYLVTRHLELTLLRGTEEMKVLIRKGEYDDIGLNFETPLMDRKHSCRNGCIFCFIDQLPKGLRDTLYFKDDDSRLSFLHGNYITLTNTTDRDIDRMIKMRFSPINISVHTTNPDLRVRMMKNKRAGEVLSYLDRLAAAGLNLQGQIVLCRGINDGEELMRSMRDLSRYFPQLESVSIVPAGLTKYREGLYPLTSYSKEEARAVIRMVEDYAKECLARFGSRLFHLSDEFYLKAEWPLPDEESYEGYPQIENGVGMIRSLEEEFMAALSLLTEEETACCRRVSVATGVAAAPLMRRLADALHEKVPGFHAEVYAVVNRFFGEEITVAGLLTGKDLAEQLKEKPLYETLYIPRCALRSEGDLFLCGMSLSALSESLNIPVCPVENDGGLLLDALLGMNGGG